ncbi:MAG TPA: type ISP restriction/modification enzyme [Polyangiales bacterium]|nr:type ISP restriction/modification enzyme [Polyangiales bacterium]
MSLRPIELLAASYAAERDASLADASLRRRAAGIVHTPAELARAVVRVSDELLRDQLGLALGVAEPSLLSIDPACGPGAFIAALLALAEDRAASPVNVAGYDIDAPALGWAARLRDHSHGQGLELVHADVLKTDVIAQRARTHKGPLFVLGNPPWSTVRAEPGRVDQARLAEFHRDASGARLFERKLGVLADAYVRFFALCSELARRSEAGALVALVTNASFLDGPVHRGMRSRLLEWFDDVAVLDLGGSALLGQRRLQRDDNVFGVRPNVAITWLCRYPLQRRSTSGRARYARCFGSRAEKLEALSRATLASLSLAQHPCEGPEHSFVPRPRRDPGYASFMALSEWLPFHREGVQSNRDAVVMDISRERLLERLHAFCRGERRPELVQAYAPLPHYDPERARELLAAAFEHGEVLQRIAYRPWDVRVFCSVAPLCHRPRPLLGAALAHGGIALLSVRKDRGDLPWRHVSAVDATVDNCYLSSRSSCRTRAFPSFTPDGEPNLGPRARELLAAVGCGSCSSVDVQHYLLSVLSATNYQTCWDSELHADYPRVPMPHEAGSFERLVDLGARLAELHKNPCETTWAAPIPERGAQHKHVQLDSEAGEVRLQGQLLIALPPAALALRIGQVQPLRAYLAQRSQWPLDRAALQAIYARAERLSQLADLQSEIDKAVSECFGRFDRLVGI